jgi:phage/plasmid-associated DNA primase
LNSYTEEGHGSAEALGQRTEAPSLSEWQEATAQEISTADLDKMVAEMQEAWAVYDVKKKESTALLQKYEEIEAKVLSTLKSANKSKYHVDGLGTVYIINKKTVRVPKTISEKEALFKYLQSKGREFMMGMLTVNSQTLNAFVNQELANAAKKGDASFSIPGIEQPVTQESIGFRKG